MAVKKVIHGRGHSYEMTIKVEGKVVRRRFRTAKQANDAYAKLRQSANEGTFISAADSRITVAAYGELWLARLRVRPNTLENYRSRYRNRVAPTLGDRPLCVRGLEDERLASAAISLTYHLLARLFREAVFDGKLVRTLFGQGGLLRLGLVRRGSSGSSLIGVAGLPLSMWGDGRAVGEG